MRRVLSSALAIPVRASLAWIVTPPAGSSERRQEPGAPRPTRGGVFFPEPRSPMLAYMPAHVIAADAQFVDWFGQWRSAGEPASELRIAPVAHRTAFTPVSIGEMVAAGGPWSATIATGLTEAEADEIIALYTSN